MTLAKLHSSLDRMTVRFKCGAKTANGARIQTLLTAPRRPPSTKASGPGPAGAQWRRLPHRRRSPAFLPKPVHPTDPRRISSGQTPELAARESAPRANSSLGSLVGTLVHFCMELGNRIEMFQCVWERQGHVWQQVGGKEAKQRMLVTDGTAGPFLFDEPASAWKKKRSS